MGSPIPSTSSTPVFKDAKDLPFLVETATTEEFIVKINGVLYQVGGISLDKTGEAPQEVAKIALNLIKNLSIHSNLNENAFNEREKITFTATEIKFEEEGFERDKFCPHATKINDFTDTFKQLQELSQRVDEIAHDYFHLNPSYKDADDFSNPLFHPDASVVDSHPLVEEDYADALPVSVPPLKTTLPVTATSQPFSLDSNGISSLYKDKRPLREDTSFKVEINAGGAANVGYKLFQSDSEGDINIGIMIAANSGLPGGMLGKRPWNVTQNDLNLPTQEESIWANVTLCSCADRHGIQHGGTQEDFYRSTIKERWGMVDSSGTGTNTKQGIDFRNTTDAASYNSCYIVKEAPIAFVNINTSKNKTLGNKVYRPAFVFADSVNANPDAGEAEGAMQRTLNQRAIVDYDFFKECIKMKLRSALDAMAKEEVTHPLVALLSCGVYAGPHETKINNEFGNILQEILNEPVGPRGEKRGQYFQDVILPKLY